jgi:hypothetical protein
LTQITWNDSYIFPMCIKHPLGTVEHKMAWHCTFFWNLAIQTSNTFYIRKYAEAPKKTDYMQFLH